MELHERVRSESPAVGPGGLPVPKLSLCHICRHRFSTGRHFHHHVEAREPALLSLTQHFGAADSVLQPLDGYLLLFITVSTPREHQFCFLCCFPRCFPRETTNTACQEDFWTIQTPIFLFYTYPRVLWKPFHNIKVKEQPQPRSI